MYAFTDGAFRMAIKEQVPVLPLALDGTRDALPRRLMEFERIAGGTPAQESRAGGIVAAIDEYVETLCGDGETSDDEECDAGDDNDDKAYGEGECTKSCLHAPYCGDHRVQGRFGESCDGGSGCTPSCDSLIE